MIIADSQEELDKIPCPSCNQHTLKMCSVLYSCPLQFIAHCTNCVYSVNAKGQAIKVLEGEDAVRARPKLYLDHENPVWRKLAEDTLAAKEE